MSQEDALSPSQAMAIFLNKRRLYYLNYINQRVGRLEDAEDIYQDCCVNIIDRLQRIDQTLPSNIKSFVFTVIKNRIIDYYRKKKSICFSDLEVNLKGLSGLDPVEEGIVSNQFNPHQMLESNLIMKVISDGLEMTPSKHRVVFIDNEFNNETFSKMSERTGININTLLSRKIYAVKYIKRHILKELPDFVADLKLNGY